MRALTWAPVLAVLLAVPVAHVAVNVLQLRLSASDGHRLLLSLTLAPLVEEWVMRSLLQRGVVQGLLRRGRTEPAAQGMAAIVATAAFALAHLDGWTLQALLQCSAWLMPGAALAATWCWRRRTADCVLMHVWFNVALISISRVSELTAGLR